MANRITQELNNMLNESGSVSDFYTRQYLHHALKAYRDRAYCAKWDEILNISGIDMYYRIAGYDLFGDKEHNDTCIKDAAGNLLGAAGSVDAPLVLSVYSDGDSVRIFYGTHHAYAGQIKKTLSGNLFAASVSNEWIQSDELDAVQAHNGFIAGVSKLKIGTADRIINSLHQESYFFNVITMPVAHEAVAAELSRINVFSDKLQRVARTELTIGSNRARRFDSNNHNILEIIEVFEKEKKRLRHGLISGMWRVAVHISAPSLPVYKKVSSTVVAAFMSNIDSENDSSLPVSIDVNFPAVRKSVWSLPDIFLGPKNLGGLYGSTALNVAGFDVAGSLIALPVHPHAGYPVKHLGESAASTGAFDRFAPDNNCDNAFELGILADGSKYMLPIDAFRQHAFVTGATQFGKSTTVQKVLVEAYKKDYPFIVIEAAKKDYWRLTQTESMRNVPVYSAGGNAEDLYINPFEPENGTRMEFHIQSLINALLSMFVQDDPLPQIITNLVYLCYEKRGWDTRCKANAGGGRKYPVLSDLLDNLDECISDIGYSEDVRDDMRGVVKVRITSLLRQVGGLFNTHRNISIKDMFKTSAIIELDDFDDVSKPFIASIFAMKANEYSRQCSMDSKLRRLLVIEEAHHILPNPELKTSTPNSQRCSGYFANMLAEVSAYGTGVIVVDQRASTISASALANTGVKIVHNIREGSDIDAVSGSMGLRTHERALLNKLGIGEAVVAIPQAAQICRVRINNGRSECNGH